MVNENVFCQFTKSEFNRKRLAYDMNEKEVSSFGWGGCSEAHQQARSNFDDSIGT